MNSNDTNSTVLKCLLDTQLYLAPFLRTMNSNDTNSTQIKCLPDTQPYLVWFLMVIVPILVVSGVVGNILNLIVLNSKGMRTKTNFVLSSMAAADLAHAVLAMLVNLHLYEKAIDSETFSWFYHHRLKLVAITLVNWLAMTSTWLAVAVTFERLIAIRSPLKARSILRKRYITAVVVLVTIISLLTCSYYLFWLRPRVVVDCADRSRRLYRLFPDRSLMYFGHISRKIHSLLCSLIPVILLFACNAMLVYHLRRNHATMEMFNDNTSSTIMANGVDQGQYERRCSAMSVESRREHQVAVVVIVISLTSACLLLPSAALVIYDGLRVAGLFSPNTPWWYYEAGDINNLLILFEKVLDFFLYCLTSSYFRRRLVVVFCYSSVGPNRHRYGGVANGTGPYRAPDTPRPLLSRAMRIRLGGKPPLLKRHSTQSTLATFASIAAERLRRMTLTSTTSASSGQSLGSKKTEENGTVDNRPTPPRFIYYHANGVNEQTL